MHAYALSDPVSGPARFPGLTCGLNGYRDPKVDIASRSVAGSGTSTTTPGSAWHFCNATRSAEDSTPATEPSVSMRSQGGWIRPPGIPGSRMEHLQRLLDRRRRLAAHRTRREHRRKPGLPVPLRNADGLVRDHLRADGSIEASIYPTTKGCSWRPPCGPAIDGWPSRHVAGDAYFTVDRLWEQAVCFNAIYAKARLRIGDLGPDPGLRGPPEGRRPRRARLVHGCGSLRRGFGPRHRRGAADLHALRFGHLIQRVV